MDEKPIMKSAFEDLTSYMRACASNLHQSGDDWSEIEQALLEGATVITTLAEENLRMKKALLKIWKVNEVDAALAASASEKKNPGA